MDGTERSVTATPPTSIDSLLADLQILVPVAIVDKAGRIHHWSAGCGALYGWSAADAIGAIKHEFLHATITGRRAPWPAVGAAPRSLEETHRDGRRIRVLEQVIPLTIAGYYALSVIRIDAGDDHGAKKPAERTLRDREAELSAILESASDAMVVVDSDGVIGAFNRAAQELLGYDGLSMIGTPIDPLIEGGWPTILAITAGAPRELRVIDAIGSRIPVDLRKGSLPGGKHSGHILFFTDISERRAREARRTLLEHAARDIAMAEFAAHMMHELNQPLAAASNFLAVARQLGTDPARSAEACGMIDMALNQIQRLGGVVRSMQLTAVGEDIDPRSVPVRAAIEDAIALVQIALGANGVEIVIDVHPEADTMFVDPVGIQQILANLLRNAIEAFGPTPRQGASIGIRSRRKDGWLHLSVHDNGPGIPTEALPDLFEPFKRSDKKSGMGLGLSICRTIAESHGGTLSAENLSESGARFLLTLPPDELA